MPPTITEKQPTEIVVSGGVAFKVCRGCGQEKSIDQFPPQYHRRTVVEAQCYDCRRAADMFHADRKKGERMKELALAVTQRLAKRHEEPVSPDEAIIRDSIRLFGGTKGVAQGIHTLIASEETKPGVKLAGYRLLLEGCQRIETRKLAKRNLDQMGSQDLVEHLMEIMVDALGDEAAEVLEAPAPRDPDALPLPKPPEFSADTLAEISGQGLGASGQLEESAAPVEQEACA